MDYAARSGDVAVLRMMLEAGADKDLPDEEGATALIMSSQGGHKEIVRLLLNNRADPLLTDDCERTALMYACSGCRPLRHCTLAFAGPSRPQHDG